MTHPAPPSPWIRLALSPGIGFSRLVEIAGALQRTGVRVEDLTSTWPASLGLSPGTAKVLAEAKTGGEEVQARLNELVGRGVRVVDVADGEYPDGLRKAPGMNVPPVVYLRGPQEAWKPPRTVVLGSREVAPRAQELAFKVGRGEALAGRALVSGGSSPTEKAALEGALKAGGFGLAVSGGGILTCPAPAALQSIAAGRLLEFSCFSPRHRETREGADFRALVTVALGERIIVVSARGGGVAFRTALAALERKAPVFVVDPQVFTGSERANEATGGNAALLEFGAKPLAIEPGTLEPRAGL